MKRLLILWVVFLFVLIVYTIGGCSDDPTTSPQSPTIPSVAKDWTGTADIDNPVFTSINLTANFAQDNENLSGYWLWETHAGGNVAHTQFYITGKIDAYRNITFEDTGYVALNWTPGPGDIYMKTCKATLNSNGDVITGDIISMPGATFVLYKK